MTFITYVIYVQKNKNPEHDCPYFDRISHASEIMKEHDLKVTDIIEEKLGENRYKNKYLRLKHAFGPIIKCDAYEGYCLKDPFYPRKRITLCGSTRFKNEFEEEMRRLTLEGNLVFSLGLFLNEEEKNSDEWNNNEIKTMLINLHIEKILMSDAIHVINKNGYIGESTLNEIEFAKYLGLEITYLEPII